MMSRGKKISLFWFILFLLFLLIIGWIFFGDSITGYVVSKNVPGPPPSPYG